MDETAIIKRIVAWGLFGIIAVLVIFGSIYTIDSGEEAVLLTFGEASPVAITPGLHFKWPLAQKVITYDMTTRKYGQDATSGSLQSAASSDLQIVKAQLAVNYHLAAGSTPLIYAQLGSGYESKVIAPSVQEVMKATTAKYTAAELVNKRGQVSSDMDAALKERLLPYNIEVEQVSITAFDFSDQFNQAIEAKVTAEQQKDKAANDLERIKIEAQQVGAAGQGQADAILAIARAEAEEIRLKNQELEKSPQYVEFIKWSRWDGKLPSWYMAGESNSITPLVTIPATE